MLKNWNAIIYISLNLSSMSLKQNRETNHWMKRRTDEEKHEKCVGLTESSCSTFWWLSWCSDAFRRGTRPSRKPQVSSATDTVSVLSEVPFHSCCRRHTSPQWRSWACLIRQPEVRVFRSQRSLRWPLRPPVGTMHSYGTVVSYWTVTLLIWDWTAKFIVKNIYFLSQL